MRERWVDHNNGMLSIQTDTMHIHINSRARKNYHTIHSHWSFHFCIKGKYGYACRIFYDFEGTFEEALERAETIVKEMYESIKEII